MKRAFSINKPVKRIIICLAILMAAGLAINNNINAAEFTVTGDVWAANGTSGSATSENSLASLTTFRVGDNQAAYQIEGENSNCPNKIYATSGSAVAYYYTDAGSQWTNLSVQAGQTIIAIVQTYSGQFSNCVWSGNPYVGAVEAIVSPSDIIATLTTMPPIQLQQIPSPALQSASYFNLSLTWTGLSIDPNNLIAGYTVYRSASLAGTYSPISYTANQVKGGPVSFTDSGVSPGNTYYYKIGVNYVWDGGSNTINYYTSYALSNPLSASTLNEDLTDLKYSLKYAPTNITVTTGEIVTLISQVSNYGSENVNNITPSQPVIVGSPLNALVLQSGPQPATMSLGSGGGIGYFTWTYLANAGGSITFTGNATGIGTSSTLYISNNSSSNPIAVFTRATLSAQTSAMPSSASLGQTITVLMTVTNSGQANAVNTSGNITVVGVTGTNPLTAVSQLSAPPSTTISGGNGVNTFTWTYSATGAGTVYFSCFASGTDQYALNAVTSLPSPSANIIIQIPASLASTIYVPATTSQGQVFTVIMSVTNSGQAAASNVIPNLTVVPATSLTPVSTPVASTINGSTLQNFTWTFSASGLGSVNFSGFASGTDANSGFSIHSSSTNTSTIIQSGSHTGSSGLCNARAGISWPAYNSDNEGNKHWRSTCAKCCAVAELAGCFSAK